MAGGNNAKLQWPAGIKTDKIQKTILLFCDIPPFQFTYINKQSDVSVADGQVTVMGRVDE